MATLKELLEGGDLGAGQYKTASADVGSNDMDGMDKLAMQLGLFGETTKTASKDEHDEEHDEDEDDHHEEKKASYGGLHDLLFPDSEIGGYEKTAFEKEASVERAMGASAYDQFSVSFDQFVEKLAGEALSGAHIPNDEHHGHGAIDTDPMHHDELAIKNDPKQVGHVKAAAFRKHMLLSVLEG